YLLLFLLICVPSLAQSQMKVRGTVTDENGEALPGTNIQLKEAAGVGTITDIDGNYNLVFPDEYANGTLVFSYLGYLTEEIAIENRSTIDIELLPDLQTLSELVVIGYGTVKKEDVTGSLTV